MIPETYQSRFNPDAKVPHAVVRKEYSVIKQFADTAKSSETSNTELKPEIMKLGLEIQDRIQEAKDNLKLKLIGIFYSLSNEERDNLDIEVFEEMYQQIESARPSLIRFLALSTPSVEEKATYSETAST